MNIKDARATVAGSIGLPSTFDGSIESYANLAPAQQVQLNEAVAVYINAYPSQFTAAQVEIARQVIGNPSFGKPLADDSLIAAAAELPGALFDSAAARLDEIKATTEKLLMIGVVVGVIYAIYRYGPSPKTAAAAA